MFLQASDVRIGMIQRRLCEYRNLTLGVAKSSVELGGERKREKATVALNLRVCLSTLEKGDPRRKGSEGGGGIVRKGFERRTNELEELFQEPASC